MPLVISKTSGSVHYIKYHETLMETLEHSNFDGEEWAVGDHVIFEDGNEAHIVHNSNASSYALTEPKSADLSAVKQTVQIPGATSWSDLFSRFH